MTIMEKYNVFDAGNHLRPHLKKADFDALHDWELGWALLEPLNIAESDDHEKELATRLSPGQKALYFFWYLDGAVTNGGFVQFYFNNYRRYLNVIKEGLILVGDQKLIELINKADDEYITNDDLFSRQISINNPTPLYELISFEALDNKYYDIHDNTMLLIERYARANPGEFVTLIPT
ncbi:DUF4375 domain-containing protein [Inquilinus sp. KBS0705]|nr:DUF4375 domain-containing protein [Inquilinus sp. KBS0705]